MLQELIVKNYSKTENMSENILQLILEIDFSSL